MCKEYLNQVYSIKRKKVQTLYMYMYICTCIYVHVTRGPTLEKPSDSFNSEVIHVVLWAEYGLFSKPVGVEYWSRTKRSKTSINARPRIQ